MSAELPPGTRTFTVEEARALLPQVGDLMRQTVAAYDGFQRVRDELAALEAQRTRDNALALARPLREKRAELGERYHTLQALLDEVGALGCLIKGFDPPLVDFPSYRDGRIVLLCWHTDEPDLAYWHETTGNYYTRRPLP
jgi:hypothetical protein